MKIAIQEFKHRLRTLLDQSNPRKDYNINRDLVSALNSEILRLSRERRPRIKSIWSISSSESESNTISTSPTSGDKNSQGYEVANTRSNNTALAADPTIQDGSPEISSSLSINEIEIIDNRITQTENPQSPQKTVLFENSSTRKGFTNLDKQMLQDVADTINKANRIIVLVGAGISTKCGISDFRSETGIHKTNRQLFDRTVLDDEGKKKDLYRILIDIKDITNSETLIQTDTHQFLRVLQKSGKLQRCYTQNIDGLEVNISKLNAEIGSKDCKVVQLHGNLDSLWCPLCKTFVAWERAYNTNLLSGAIIGCPNCKEISDKRQRQGKREITLGGLRPSISLYNDTDDPQHSLASDIEAIMEMDLGSSPDVLLIIGTSLSKEVHSALNVFNDIAGEIRRTKGKVIYINEQVPRKEIRKQVDYIVEMDCDLWVQDLATRQPSLWDCEIRQGVPSFLSLGFQPKAKTVNEVIKEAELKLISVGDYSDIQFRTRTRAEVNEDLSTFLPGAWLSTSPLMGVLSLFEWDEATKVIHSSLTNFDMNNVEIRKKRLEGILWPIGRNHTRIIVPHNPGSHWVLIEVDIPGRIVRYYNSLPGYNLIACCKYVQEQVERVGKDLGQDYSTWKHPVDGHSHQQTNFSDCGVFLLENARRLSQGKIVNGEPVDADSLRVLFAELLLLRSLYEASERNMLKNLLYPESSRLWQVGTASYRHEPDSQPPKKRLRLEDIESQRASIDENSSESEENDTEALDISAIKAEALTLFKSLPLCPWMKHLELLSKCHIQRDNTSMGYPRAFRLLQMVAAFGCPEHFVALKEAITHYRGLGPEKVVSEPVELPSHLYQVGLWTEHLGLINTILQRLVRAHFTSLIEEGKELILNKSRKEDRQIGDAISQAIKALVVQIHPRMRGWDISDNPAQKVAFLKVQRHLQRWKQEGAIWSLIQGRFSSLAVLALAPHQIRVLPTAQSISGSSFQNEIPRNARSLFVDALAELRPSLWTYVPKLAHLFDVLFNPSKLQNCQFKIELATDDEIRDAAPDSKILIDAFEYSQTPTIQPLGGAIASQSSIAHVPKRTVEASRLGLFDDILTHFYLKQHQFWAKIKTNNPHFEPPGNSDNLLSQNLDRLARLKPGKPAAKDAVNIIFENIGLKNQTSELDQKVFHKHLISYANLRSPGCPVKISMTNRYTVNTFEGAVAAKRSIRKGEVLHHLCGILGEINGPACPSAVESTIVSTTGSKNPKEYLLLGPARFVNYDCKPNAEFLASGDHEILIKALRGIENGEEITVKYGKAYFAPDYSTCLCGSCEIQSLNGWAGRGCNANRPEGQHARTDTLRRCAPSTPLITESQSEELKKLSMPLNRFSEDYMLKDSPLFKGMHWYECNVCKRRSSIDYCLFCDDINKA